MGQKLLNSLEKRFGNYAVHNITLHIIGAQVLFWALIMMGHINPMSMVMDGEAVLNGELWRVLTFVCMPPNVRPLFIIFAWLIFHLMGTSLEEHWGTFKYNLYLIIGFIGSILMCIVPAMFANGDPTQTYIVSNLYFQGSVFFAFAYLFPNYEFHLFFFLPVKVKWLGILTAVFFAMAFFGGGLSTKLLIIGGVANFFIFFGKEIVTNFKAKKRRTDFTKKQKVTDAQAFHTCRECGIDDNSHPEMTFRYCSKCGKGFCEEHITDHGCE